MIWKKIVSFVCASLFPLLAQASTIPQYQIASRTGVSITMTDGSAFSVNGLFAPIATSWNPGDLLYLAQNDITYFPPVITRQGGLPVIQPMYILYNTTQNTSAVGYLATLSTPLPLSLQMIDPVNGVIALSDATAWKIRTIDQRYFTEWSIPDVIMIGENLGSDRASYDAIIFNASQLQTVRAYQVLP